MCDTGLYIVFGVAVYAPQLCKYRVDGSGIGAEGADLPVVFRYVLQQVTFFHVHLQAPHLMLQGRQFASGAYLSAGIKGLGGHDVGHSPLLHH